MLVVFHCVVAFCSIDADPPQRHGHGFVSHFHLYIYSHLDIPQVAEPAEPVLFRAARIVRKSIVIQVLLYAQVV